MLYQGALKVWSAIRGLLDPIKRKIFEPNAVCPRASYFALMTAVSAGLQVGFATAETPGDLFRKQMSQLKARCAKGARTPGDITCDMLTLRVDDPLTTQQGRLAQSIKLPPTVPQRTYRLGMTSNEYFRELCHEAGEFVFQTVSAVEGVIQLRPRNIATGQMLRHLYAMEDPYGYRDWEARNPESFFVKPSRYRFLESLQDSDGASRKVIRYHGYDGRHAETMKSEISTTAKSQYGFIWRGISREQDRELGIAGGELIVLEVEPLRVLAVKRGFARTAENEPVQYGIWWGRPTVCPGDSNSIYALAQFVIKVLVPAQQ